MNVARVARAVKLELPEEDLATVVELSLAALSEARTGATDEPLLEATGSRSFVACCTCYVCCYCAYSACCAIAFALRLLCVLCLCLFSMAYVLVACVRAYSVCLGG